MKKYLFTFASVVIMVSSSQAQDDNFDKKFRFGLRATPQPTWIKSNNKNSSGNGATFGFGFGLITEFKLSKVVHFQTGIGGDIEGGHIRYRNDNEFAVNAVLNNEGEYVEAEDNLTLSEFQLKSGNSQFQLIDRKYKTTFVTIPVLLKMMTQEYNGLKYFAIFGGELGIRAGVKANDTYLWGLKTTTAGSVTTQTELKGDDLTLQNVNLSKDGSLLPFRFGMNLGGGTEYRLGGSTTLFASINYFHSFTNLMRKDSKYLYKEVSDSDGDGKQDFSPLNQGYFQRAIRINIGIMF